LLAILEQFVRGGEKLQISSRALQAALENRDFATFSGPFRRKHPPAFPARIADIRNS